MSGGEASCSGMTAAMRDTCFPGGCKRCRSAFLSVFPSRLRAVIANEPRTSTQPERRHRLQLRRGLAGLSLCGRVLGGAARNAAAELGRFAGPVACTRLVERSVATIDDIDALEVFG